MYQYDSEIAGFQGVHPPPGLPELSEYKSISMNLKLLFSGGRVDLPLDVPPGLPELPEYESISMNLKFLFSGA